MTKRIGKLQLHKETMRHLTGGTHAEARASNVAYVCPYQSYVIACPVIRNDDAQGRDAH
jgi:hypothetical protein